jgi:hypothetical protein
MLVSLIERIFFKYAVDISSFLLFMKIGTGVQAVLRFCLRNLRGCNVGITDGKDL